jgi:transcriptional regulator GlxA family with amidase domain
MRQLLEVIEANLDQPLTLDVMAAHVGISALYLARAFKAAIGQSPRHYVLACRIDRAKELLRNTEMPIIDVALSVGFSSQRHLSHWMLRHTGVTPPSIAGADEEKFYRNDGPVILQKHDTDRSNLDRSESRILFRCVAFLQDAAVALL